MNSQEDLQNITDTQTAETEGTPDHESSPPPASETPIVEATAEVTAKSAGGILLTKTHMIIAAVLAVALLAGGFTAGYFLTRDKNPLGIDPNVQYYGNMHAGQVNPNPEQILIPGFGRLVFGANDPDVSIELGNPQGNPCYFRYTLRLSDTGEVLYTGGLIPPGMMVDKIKLSRGLPRGEYKVIIEIETFSLDESLTPMNGASAEVALFCN